MNSKTKCEDIQLKPIVRSAFNNLNNIDYKTNDGRNFNHVKRTSFELAEKSDILGMFERSQHKFSFLSSKEILYKCMKKKISIEESSFRCNGLNSQFFVINDVVKSFMNGGCKSVLEFIKENDFTSVTANSYVYNCISETSEIKCINPIPKVTKKVSRKFKLLKCESNKENLLINGENCSNCKDNIKSEGKDDTKKLNSLRKLCVNNTNAKIEPNEELKHFKCNSCNKSFMSKSKLNKHLKFHKYNRTVKDEEKYSRESYSFRDRSKLQNSVPNIESKILKCQYCHKLFQKVSTFNRHKSFHANKKLIKCSYCQACFSHASRLKKHMNLHRCSFCKKVFDFQLLKNHLKSHAKSERARCNFCKKHFCSSFKLKKHLENHALEKMNCKNTPEMYNLRNQSQMSRNCNNVLSCDYCGKKFYKHVGHFKKHLISHTKNISLKVHANSQRNSCRHNCECLICRKTFPSLSALNDHLVVHESSAWECKTCNKYFSSYFTLRRHNSSYH